MDDNMLKGIWGCRGKRNPSGGTLSSQWTVSMGHPWEYIEGRPWDFPLAYPRLTLGQRPLWDEALQGFFLGSVRGNSLLFALEFNILPRESIENSWERPRGLHFMESIECSPFSMIPPWLFHALSQCTETLGILLNIHIFLFLLSINTQQLLNIQRWIIGTLSIHTRHSKHPHSAHSASHSAVLAFTLGTCWVYSQQSQQMRWAETFSSVCCNSINPYHEISVISVVPQVVNVTIVVLWDWNQWRWPSEVVVTIEVVHGAIGVTDWQ